MQIETSAIPLQEINNALTKNHNIRLYIWRLDLIHPHISGNKLFKLKYNIEEAKKNGKDTLLTFGGAYSNHIAATAFAGKEYGFKTIGIIRGNEISELNPTLQFATDCGMQLHYVSREEYKTKDTKEFLQELITKFPNAYIIPEGGANELGIKGCKEIVNNIPIDFDYICCPCGTGTTLAGIILSLQEHQQAIGFQVLKGKDYIKSEVTDWLAKFNYTNNNNWRINEDYHFGGYAKVNTELKDFKTTFEKENSIPLDYIYTAKMMFGIYSLIEKGLFEKNKTIIALHTGGLQGNAGFE